MNEEIELTGDAAKLERQEQGHSPTPWEVIAAPSDYADPKAQCHYEIASDELIVAVTIGDEVPEEEANARFIVRAVNNHGALLEQLRESALAVHTIGAYHNPSWTAFEECDKPLCASARRVLSAVDSQ